MGSIRSLNSVFKGRSKPLEDISGEPGDENVTDLDAFTEIKPRKRGPNKPKQTSTASASDTSVDTDVPAVSAPADEPSVSPMFRRR